MKFGLIVILCISCVFIQLCEAEDCSYPWRKVDDNICLFLTASTKTWDHAKFLCGFYGGDLLYIENEQEQKIIKEYLSKLIKYRFNRKPYVWLDAVDKETEADWLWSRNNQTVSYGNWIPSYHNNGIKSKSLNCACYKPNNGYWKDCDCSLTQHFTCRKSLDRVDNFKGTDKMMAKFIIEETPNMAGFNEKIEETKEVLKPLDENLISEESIINKIKQKMQESERLFLDIALDEDKEKESELTTTTTPEPKINKELLDSVAQKINIKPSTKFGDDDLMLDIEIDGPINFMDLPETTTTPQTTTESPDNEIMFDLEIDVKPQTSNSIDISFTSSHESDKESNQQKLAKLISSKLSTLKFNKKVPVKHTETSIPITIMTKTVKKMDRTYKQFHCPQGLGYYLIENTGCTKYKYCENWNDKFSSLSINKCHKGVFSFNERKCVSFGQYTCDEYTPKFIPEI